MSHVRVKHGRAARQMLALRIRALQGSNRKQPECVIGWASPCAPDWEKASER